MKRMLQEVGKVFLFMLFILSPFMVLVEYREAYLNLVSKEGRLFWILPAYFQLLIFFISAYSISIFLFSLVELYRFFKNEKLFLRSYHYFSLFIIFLSLSVISKLAITWLNNRLHIDVRFPFFFLVILTTVIVFFLMVVLAKKESGSIWKALIEHFKRLFRKPVFKKEYAEVISALERNTFLFFSALCIFQVLFINSWSPFHSLEKASVSWKEEGVEYGIPNEFPMDVVSYLLPLMEHFGINNQHIEKAVNAFQKRKESSREVTVIIVDHFNRLKPSICVKEVFGISLFLPCRYTHGALVEKVLREGLPNDLKGLKVKIEEVEVGNSYEKLLKVLREEREGLVIFNVSLAGEKKGIPVLEQEFLLAESLIEADRNGIVVFTGAGNEGYDHKFKDLELAKALAFVLPNVYVVGSEDFQVGELLAPSRVKLCWEDGVCMYVAGTSFSTPIALANFIRELAKEKKEKIEERGKS